MSERQEDGEKIIAGMGVIENDLPDEWITVSGRTEELSMIYDEIYKDGTLLYEIEEFDDKGNCKIRYCR